MADDKNRNGFTNRFGVPVDDDITSITAGEHGPGLVQDVHLLDKLAHFARERIPERVVHAKGAGAYGYFEVTNDVTQWCRADFLSEVGRRTEMFARFSTVGGEKGSADSDRDPRGFALKFYTNEGNYDLVGNNTPVFFIRDAMKFPDFIHTQKRNPQTNLKDPNAFWDFLSLTPESNHQVTILFSDRGTPRGYQHMDGFGSHTFMWFNEKCEHFWIKYHFKVEGGCKNFDRHESTELAGKDPDQATRSLFDDIEAGRFPTWNLSVQIMNPEDAEKYRFNPFDVTKVWPHGDYPLIPVGKMVLNKNPENFFADVEQAAFSPGNFIPGINASPDKMLQGRLVNYHDTHRHRLGGSNYHLLPVNAARNHPQSNYQRDGGMRFDGNGGGSPNYFPNSFGGPEPTPAIAPPPLDLKGMADRYPVRLTDDDFVQAGALFSRVMSDMDREHLIGNIVGHLGGAIERIQYRQAAVFYKCHEDYGGGVAKGLGLDVDKVRELAGMSQEDRVKATADGAPLPTRGQAVTA